MAGALGRLRRRVTAVSDRPRPPWITSVFVILLVLLSVGRVISTYRTFSQVEDEPAHIACGLEWWQNGDYKFDPEHPPLSRIFVSALLYYQGVRIDASQPMWAAGNAALTARGRYAENLASARLGTLPFWIMSCIILFALAKQYYGGATAFLSLLLYSTLPPALGFAGLAYTDTALVAGMLFFTWRWVALVDRPDLRNGFWLGLSIGFALLSKYSSVPYMAVAAVLTAIVAIRARGVSSPRWAPLIRAGSVVLCIAVTTLFFTWACFRFSVAPASSKTTHRSVDQRLGSSGLLHQVAYAALETPLPLTEVAQGVARVVRHANQGVLAYNFGKPRLKGVFYYFPALTVLTIPVGLLAMLILAGVSYRRAPNGDGVQFLRRVLFTVPAAVLFVNCASSLNMGHRHNLAFYPFVCLAGAIGCVFWWSRGRPWMRLLVLVLIGQHLISSALAHPDYSSYFNFLAGRQPEEICNRCVFAGDEWRLASRLRQLHATHVCLALQHDLPLDALGLPPYSPLTRNTPCEGWVAVAMERYLFDQYDHDNPDPLDTGFAWLKSYEPAERIGSSILLFRVPSPPLKAGRISLGDMGGQQTGGGAPVLEAKRAASGGEDRVPP